MTVISNTFTKDKVTKNTVRFTSPKDSEVSGSIYVPKSHELADKEEIEVQVSGK